MFEEEVTFYRSILPRNALCFDIGANIGDKSEALLAAGVGRVVAFEPNPLVLSELRARCGHNPEWMLVEAAVGRNGGMQTFYAHRAHGQSSLLAEWGGEVVAKMQVRVTTLDAAIESFGIPHFCKIDVEGFEEEVLAGLSKSVPMISFEFHLNDEGVRRAQACLMRLGILTSGNAEVNVTAAETARFCFSGWRAIRDFMAWFPGDLRGSLQGDSYGDIFVRSGEC